MSEKDTIEVNSSSEKINKKIDKGQAKVNEAINDGKEKLDDKIDEKQEKINNKIDKSKNVADKVANDLSKGMEEFFENIKGAQKKLNDKINDYNKTVTESLDIDLVEDAKNYYIKAATPGINKEDISIEAGDYEISIEVEFPSYKEDLNCDDEAELILKELKDGKCIKTITFINQIDIHNIKAIFDKGNTIITIPKIETPKAKVTVE